MRFKSLNLNQFRNISNLDLSFSKNLNIFVGDNGQGKTNCVEALYFAIRGESFRYGENSVFVKNDSSWASIKCLLEENNLDYNLKILFNEKNKSFNLNEKKVNSSELQKLFSVVLFSPESLSSIKEGSDFRRQLVDEFLTNLDRRNAVFLLNYKKVLKTRNKILKNFSSENNSRKESLDLLESINPIFLKEAIELTIKRNEALKNILPGLNRAMREITGKNVDISVEYVVSGQSTLNFSKNQIADLIKNRMLELRESELSSGVSLVGPQKHDVRFLYNGKDSRFFCSQGQQRALILSFKMAQIVYHRKVHGTYPILLLDDVLSELDKEKGNLLINFLTKVPTQIFITTTDISLPDSFLGNECFVFKLEEGQTLKIK